MNTTHAPITTQVACGQDRASSEPAKLGAPLLLGIGGAGLAAFLSASCCVLPLALGLVGLGGSWLAFLGPFVAWREPILLGTGALLLLAWIVVVRRGFARIRPRALVVTGLATASLALAATAPVWERDVQGALIDMTMERMRMSAAADVGADG